jgi:hypothetical protein
MAMTLDDVLSRRTRSTVRRAAAAADAAAGLGELLGPEWGRDPQAVAGEATDFAERVRRDLARAGLDPARRTP